MIKTFVRIHETSAANEREETLTAIRDLARRADDMRDLLKPFGPETLEFQRSEEVRAAVQRLLWAVAGESEQVSAALSQWLKESKRSRSTGSSMCQ